MRGARRHAMRGSKREYFISVFFIFVVVVFYGISSYLAYTPLAMWTAALSMFMGGFLLAFGFWGADYAMSTALGELDQKKQNGGVTGKVYVPFVRNYTPTEWWNLNWFIITIGVVLACSGFLILGIIA